MSNPYEKLGQKSYWKTAVADPGPFGLSELWTPKFPVKPSDRIVTFGSCFAQHFGKALALRGYNWFDCEPAPPFLPADLARDYGYGVFSVRTGNIYTPRMLLQWLTLAFEDNAQRGELWEQDGRWFDPLRPAIEPSGFESAEEVWEARDRSCAALRRAATEADIFVFTLGLTECWKNTETGMEYALCPGTAAGTFDPDRHEFSNTTHRMTQDYLDQALHILKQHNPQVRVLLTVSPVPLTATASGQHVMVATQYSKSVLRACAGMAAEELPFVDYFPSFEIITHPVFRGMFFAPNMRSVVPAGVNTVMEHFFADQARAFGSVPKPVESAEDPVPASMAEDDLRCEEELLNAFAP